MNLDPVLHIGAAKCGSSSLQRALSLHPNFRSRDGIDYRYIVVRPERILGGWAIKLLMKSSHRSYLQSASIGETVFSIGQNGNWKPREASLERIRKKFAQMRRRGQVPVLSNEGYFGHFSQKYGPEILNHLDTNARIFTFVRPQVEWINSAWWQWGIWGKEPFETDFDAFLLQARAGCAWARSLKRIGAQDRVSQLYVGLSRGDVVTRFFEALSCEPPQRAMPNENQSLDLSAIRFLLKNRELRQGMHDSKAALALAKIDIPDRVKPWCLSGEQVEFLIEKCRLPNKALALMLDQKDAEIMRKDPRWWSADAYDTSHLHDVSKPEFWDGDDAQEVIFAKDLKSRGFRFS